MDSICPKINLGNISKDSLVRIVLVLILFSGILLRVINYFHNSGLWLDEALLALNLMEKSFSQLLLPLDRNQVAPVLFLWIEKLSIMTYGPGELALRLFALLCSLLSLPLFYFVAKDLLKDEKIALIAFFIFALAPIQIRYSAEVKQYMTDVFVFLLLIWLFLRFRRKNDTKSLVLLSLSGIIMIFLSNTTVFVLFTIGIYWIISDLLLKRLDRSMFTVLALWLITFGIYYYFFIANHKNEQLMINYWKDNFVPLNLFSSAFRRFFNTVGRKVFFELMIYNQEGLSFQLNRIIIVLYLIIYFLGLIKMIISRDIKMIFFLTFPLILHVVVSGMNIYPFETKFLLYLSPIFYMTIVCGLSSVLELSERLLKVRWPGIVILILILAIIPYKSYLNIPYEIEGTRDCIYHINENYTVGQKVYVEYYASFIYEYYDKTGKVKWNDQVILGAKKIKSIGRGDKSDWQADLAELQKNQGECWLLFCHLTHPIIEKHLLRLEDLKKIGTIKQSFHSKLSAAYLIELSVPAISIQGPERTSPSISWLK